MGWGGLVWFYADYQISECAAAVAGVNLLVTWVTSNKKGEL